jgi:predicted transcriptional regulator
MAKKSNNSTPVSVRLSNEVMLAVCERAIKEGETPSSLIRKAVSEYVGLIEGVRSNSAKAKLERLMEV